MQELRPDTLTDEVEPNDERKADESVIAPTEPLDDRDEREPEFTVDERLSSSNTDFGGTDPAL